MRDLDCVDAGWKNATNAAWELSASSRIIKPLFEDGIHIQSLHGRLNTGTADFIDLVMMLWNNCISNFNNVWTQSSNVAHKKADLLAATAWRYYIVTSNHCEVDQYTGINICILAITTMLLVMNVLVLLHITWEAQRVSRHGGDTSGIPQLNWSDPRPRIRLLCS